MKSLLPSRDGAPRDRSPRPAPCQGCMAAAVSGASQRGAARAARPAPRRTGQRRGPSPAATVQLQLLLLVPAAAAAARTQTQLRSTGYGRCGNAGQGVHFPRPQFRAQDLSAAPLRRRRPGPRLRFSGHARSQSSSSSGLSSAGSPILVRRRPGQPRPPGPPPAPPGSAAPGRGGAQSPRARVTKFQLPVARAE